MTMHLHGSLLIEAEGPFNYDLTLKATPPAYPFVYFNGVLKRAITLNSGKRVPLRVKSLGTVDKPLLKVEVLTELNPQEAEEVKSSLTWFFSLDYDLKAPYRVMEGDEVLRRFKGLLYGVKPWVTLTPFEGLINAVLFQQLSLRVAFSMIRSLVERLGPKLTVGSCLFYDYPSPETLASASIEDLKSCKLSRNKAAYVKGLARSVMDGSLNLNELKKMSSSEAVEVLKGFKGVGTWTAEIALATGLRRFDVLPVDDLGVRRAVSRFYFKGRPVTGLEVRRLAEKWGEHKWTIAYYLLVANERLPTE